MTTLLKIGSSINSQLSYDYESQSVGVIPADILVIDMGPIPKTIGLDLLCTCFEPTTPLGGCSAVYMMIRTDGINAFQFGSTFGLVGDPGIIFLTLNIVIVGNIATFQIDGIVGLTINWKTRITNMQEVF